MYVQALDRFDAFDTDSGKVLLLAAVRRHPHAIAPHFDYLWSFPRTERSDSIYRRLIRGHTGPFFDCLRAVYDAPTDYPAGIADRLFELERRHGPTTCSTVFLARITQDLRPASQWNERSLTQARAAVAAAPEITTLWIWYAWALGRTGRRDQIAGAMRDGIARVAHASGRAELYLALADAQHQGGETSNARALRRAVAAAIQRDSRPAVRMLMQTRFAGSVPSAAERASIHDETLRLAVGARDPLREMMARHVVGWRAGNAGDVATAIDHFSRALHLADSLGATADRFHNLVARGRMLTKAGRFEESERDLLTVLDAARGPRFGYLRVEAHHNLTHAYEGMGRIPDALRAGDAFVAAARPLRHAQPRLMSLHDAGTTRWRAGLHASANAAFDEMLRVVDQQDQHHYWAGSYLEQRGDLERALQYYRASRNRTRDEQSLTLAALSRVFQALGMPDSAQAAAREHDALGFVDQLDVPLLPDILCQQGRFPEAVRIASAWVARREAGGNVQSETLARIQLAEILLRSGDYGGAARQAARAAASAQSANLAAERTESLRLEGIARTRAGDAETGLTRLHAAAAAAARHPTHDAVRATQHALGDALAAAGQPDSALAAYDRAAAAVEAATSQLAADVNRVRFRERQLAPYDAAIALLIARSSDASAADATLRWSQRRKAVALTMALRSEAAEWPVRRPPLARRQLSQRLPAGSALIDFIVTDEVVAATVVTRDAARIVRLDVSADSLAALAERLRRPFRTSAGGAVDVARARFDLAAAHELYRALIAPLTPYLRHATKLTIVPDGSLHRVPLDALVTAAPSRARAPDYARASYLVDQYEIATLPSAAYLPGVDQRPEFHSVLALHNDAPGGARELAIIRDAWPRGAVKLFTGGTASESAARAALGQYDVLHLAAHAEAHDGDPLASHLRLAADSANDGLFHVGEVAEIGPTARLVVLSACATLEGPNLAGEGLMGLARGFLAGGAESVVATHWPVGANTADLMGVFHRELAAGGAPAAALRAGKLALRRNTATAHPFYWGSFTLIEGGRRP